MRKIFFTLLVSLIGLIPLIVNGQPHPPPPPSGGNNGNSLNGPSGAPIGGGLDILLLLGLAYGSKKLYQSRKDSQEE